MHRRRFETWRIKIGTNHFESIACSLMRQHCALGWHMAWHNLFWNAIFARRWHPLEVSAVTNRPYLKELSGRRHFTTWATPISRKFLPPARTEEARLARLLTCIVHSEVARLSSFYLLVRDAYPFFVLSSAVRTRKYQGS